MPPETPPHWRDKLSFLRVLDRPLFDPAFLTAWGDEIWDPNDEDRKAAAELHVQLISRITTQRLGYGEGNEVAALRSVHQFFEKTREITGQAFWLSTCRCNRLAGHQHDGAPFHGEMAPSERARRARSA
jgi:hypothetical protein